MSHLKLARAIAISFLTILLILFFWQEKLSVSNKINDQKITNFFFIVGVLGTAFSLVLLYRQILMTQKASNDQIQQLQEERKLSNLPDLYPELTNYEMYEKSDTNLFGNGPQFSVYPKRIEPFPIESNTSHIYLHNIGLGAAKEIQIKWLFDVDEVSKMIEVNYHWDNHKQDNDYTDFISQKDKGAIHPPYFYFQCCGEKLNDEMIDRIPNVNGTPATLKPKPQLKLQLTYKDILNNEHKKLFDVTVDAFLKNVTLSFKEKRGE